jgi:hypothetical protein
LNCSSLYAARYMKWWSSVSDVSRRNTYLETQNDDSEEDQ